MARAAGHHRGGKCSPSGNRWATCGKIHGLTAVATPGIFEQGRTRSSVLFLLGRGLGADRVIWGLRADARGKDLIQFRAHATQCFGIGGVRGDIPLFDEEGALAAGARRRAVIIQFFRARLAGGPLDSARVAARVTADGIAHELSGLNGATLRRFWDVRPEWCRHAISREGRRPRRPRATSLRAATADPAREAAGPPKHGLT